MTYDQQEFDIRLEWGKRGVDVLAPISDVVIIVDVLSFTTCVDVAVSRGAVVFPYAGPREGAVDYAAAHQAELAYHRGRSRYSLSPDTLQTISAGTRLVLPSPNGSTLTMAAKSKPVLAGCLRNAEAVAAAARQMGQTIAVIAAGERWKDDASLRPSFEDLLGAGAICHYLGGQMSPEARAAAAAFETLHTQLNDLLRQCSSGKELIEKGFVNDVILASQLNVSSCVPFLQNDAYQFYARPN